MIGRRLSHYLIEERLGAGGMGEVYRARDEKLGRDVALKVLPPHALGDEEARRRFRKEAVVLSRLSHPHVATLFDFDSADGIDFLVMELVLGPTLEQELRQGPLAEKDVLRLGSQLARGLVAAHEQGVVHRDLKPSNLQLTADGMLKILDFGVARLERRASSRSDTETATETSPGDVIGSPPYMAPEQLLGKAVDARTDVYAAGACLYEMATGQRPHGDKHGAALTEAILHEAVAPPRSKNGALSSGLESVILKCLDREPGLRYPNAGDLLVDLERLQVSATLKSASHVPQATHGWRRRWPWFVAVAGVAVAAVALSWLLRPLPSPRITSVRPLHLDLGWYSAAGLVSTWATDGVRVYYVGRRNGESRLFQVPALGGEPSEIEIPAPLRRGLEIYAFLPSRSSLLCLGLPDEGPSTNDWPVWIVPVPKGAPRRLAEVGGNTAAASRDGRRIALLRRRAGQLVMAQADGSAVRLLASTPSSPGFVTWSPDDRIRFSAQGPGQIEPWLWETSPRGEAPRALWPGLAGAWTSDGRIFVFQRWNQTAKRFDLFAVRERGRWPWTKPQPTALTTGPMDFTMPGPRPDGGGLFAFGATRRGELLRYEAGSRRFVPYLGGPSVSSVDFSPDRQWVAWTTWPEGTLWRGRVDGSERLQLVPDGLWAGLPRWSPDGRWIAFTGQPAPGESRSLSRVSAQGGRAEVMARAPRGLEHWDVCWLTDGRSLVFSYLQRQPGLSRIDVETRRVEPWTGAERLLYPKCSPQGRVFAMEVSPVDRGLTAADARIFLPERGTWQAVSVPGRATPTGPVTDGS